MHIVAVFARPLDVPMKKAFGISGGAQVAVRNVIVELVLADGTRGWGEAAPFPAFNGETQERALSASSRAAALLEGAELDDTQALRHRIAEACTESPSARCALETAIVDARARRAGKPLHILLGGAEQELITDITITTGTVEEASSEARAFAAFRTLKIKVGGSSVDHDVARVRAVRTARPDASILVDANAGYSVDEAIRFAKELERDRIALFEQPILPGDWAALREVREQTGLAIAIDESVTAASDVTAAKQHRAADAVNVKIMKSGIFEALAIIERARDEGLTRMIGGMVETRLAMSASACIAAGVGGFTFIDLDTPLFLAEDPFEGGYRQADERIDLTTLDVGLGLSPRERSGSGSGG